jgi:hypothetical protein
MLRSPPERSSGGEFFFDLPPAKRKRKAETPIISARWIPLDVCSVHIKLLHNNAKKKLKKYYFVIN